MSFFANCPCFLNFVGLRNESTGRTFLRLKIILQERAGLMIDSKYSCETWTLKTRESLSRTSLLPLRKTRTVVASPFVSVLMLKIQITNKLPATEIECLLNDFLLFICFIKVIFSIRVTQFRKIWLFFFLCPRTYLEENQPTQE